MYARHSDSRFNAPMITRIMFLRGVREMEWRVPVKTIEKLGDGEKTIEAVDRIDGGDVVFGVVFRRIMSYSSQIGRSSTIIHCVDFGGRGVINEIANEQIFIGSFV